MARIDSVIDQQSVQAELEFVESGLDGLFNQIKSFEGVRVRFEGANSVRDLAAAQNQLIASSAQLSEITQRVIDRKAKFNGTSKDVTQQIRTEAIAVKDLAKANLDNTKAEGQSIKNKQLLEKYSTSLTKERDKQAKAAIKEVDNLAKLNNAYEQLKTKYLIAANTAKQLAAEELAVVAAHGAESNAALEAARSTEMATNAATGYYNQLIKIEKSVGQAQRQVGQYTQATFALTQVLREAPAFANSFATGISGISNNVPMLVDQFKILRSELGSGLKAFKVLAGSLLSFTAILPIAFLLIQVFSKEITGFFSKIFSGKKNVDDITESMQKFGAESEETKRKLDNLATAIDYLNRISDIRLRITVGDDFERTITSLSGASIQNRQLISDLEDGIIGLRKNASLAFRELLDNGSSTLTNLVNTYSTLSEIPQKTISGLKEADQALLEGAIKAEKVLDESQLKLKKVEQDQKIIYAEIAAARAEEQRRLDEEAAKSLKDLSERERKAALELFKYRMDLLIEEQKILSRSSDQNTAIRARTKQAELEFELIQGVAKFELAQADLIASEKRLIVEREAEELKQAVRDRELAITKIILESRKRLNEDLLAVQKAFNDEEQKEAAKKEADRLKEKQISDLGVDFQVKVDNLKDSAEQEYKIQLDLYRKGLLSKEQFEAKVQNIEKNSIRNSLELQVKYYQDLLLLSDLPVDKQIEAYNKLNDALRAIRKLDLDSEKELVDEKRKLWKDLYKSLEDFGVAYFDGQFEREKNAIQDQIDLVDQKKQKDIEAANQSILSTQEKASQIAIIEARANAQKEQLERKRRSVEERQAEFERAKQIFDIGVETAKSLFKIKANAAVLASTPATLPLVPLALSQIPILLGISALQIGAILARPIPRYEKGTDSAEPGLAIWGEKGRELMIDKKGNLTLSPDRPTLTQLMGGEKILPAQITQDILHASSLTHLLKMQSKTTPIKQRDINEHLIKQYTDKVVRAIQDKPMTIINEIHNDANWHAYINQHIKS